jgi:hypothetical protein
VQLDNIIYVAIKRGDIIINTSFYRHLVPWLKVNPLRFYSQRVFLFNY